MPLTQGQEEGLGWKPSSNSVQIHTTYPGGVVDVVFGPTSLRDFVLGGVDF